MQDVVAERAVLAGIIRYGADAYYDVADIINENSFTLDSNAILYKICKTILDKDDKIKFDIPTIYSTAKQLDLHEVYQDKTESQHLQAIMNFPVEISNVRKFGATVAKLAVGRLLSNQLAAAQDKLRLITGEETYAHILGIAEDSIFNFSSLLNDTGGPELLGSDLDEKLKFLEDNPVEQIGISTGIKRLDFAIGGGLRPGTVNVVGARPKIGKTSFANQVSYHISGEIGIPVLDLDTEMLKEDHQHKAVARISKVPIEEIETGKFGKNSYNREQVYKASKKIKASKFYHQCIGGMPFEEQLAIMRRWLVKEVGLNANNTAKPCVIVYDYLKLMTQESISNNIQEFQALGFMMTGLHNFGLRYRVPILCFIQLNRDGINKESTDAASGSDRIVWLCSNFSILKKKSDEEIGQDGPDEGNRKLVPIVCRHGAGLDDGDYINLQFNGSICEFTEMKTRFEVASSTKKKGKGKSFDIVDGNNNKTTEGQEGEDSVCPIG